MSLAESLGRIAADRTHIEPLLRPHQEADLDAEIRRVEAQLHMPPHLRNRLDQGQQRKESARLKRDRERLTPRAFAGPELDQAIKLERAMREKLTAGMLTQEDMRRNPPGAADRLRAWERENKRTHALWQNLRLKLRASGETFGGLDTDIANLEVYRPSGMNRSMDMQGAQINRPDWHIPANVSPATVFSDAEERALRDLSPVLADSLATATNEQRAKIKAILVDRLTERLETAAAASRAPRAAAAPKPAKPGRKPMSAEARKAAGDRLRAINAAKRGAAPTDEQAA